MFRTIAFILVILAVFLAGCDSYTPVAKENGTVRISSEPPGAEVYLDSVYRGVTPVTIPAVPAGSHALEVRKTGYEPWSAPVNVTEGGTVSVPVALAAIPATLPVTYATVTPTPRATSAPQIHVDGYWTWPQPQTTGNPALLLVHTESFNVGTADAREVTVSAFLYHEGRDVCWDRIYLGTLRAGGHVAKDSMISCNLPSGLRDQDLTIRFENVVVNP